MESLRLDAADCFPENIMGIQDREYMRRRPEEDVRDRLAERDPLARERRVAEWLAGFSRRHPRFFLRAAWGVVILVVLALAIAKLTAP